MDYGRSTGFGTSRDTKYHGFLNQGATCYLNSVLQVLFMTKDFREAVERHNPENLDAWSIDFDLKALFDDLKDRSACTYRITNKLGIDRVYEQRDAAEYFEKILRRTSPEASQIFHGQLTHRTICSACGKVTDANGPFWHLPLALVDSYKGHYSVAGGIEGFFKASNISGENQLYCEQCDAKADATVKSVLTHHPEVLMLLLKRFEFDYQYMAYVKRNCFVAVPYILQIPENQTYELYAFVEHSGDLRSGHYTATIKDQDDDRWYKFNDASVTLLNFQPYQVDHTEESRTAYLLFYRKKTSKTKTVSLTCSGNDCKDDVRQRIPDTEDKRGLFPTETQPNEREEDHIYGGAGMDDIRQRKLDINHDFKPRASDSHARHEQRRQMVDKTDEEAKSADDEQSEKKERSLTKYTDSVAKQQDHERFGDVRYIDEHEGGKQLVSLGKKGDEEKMDKDVKDDEEGKTGADRLTSKRGTNLRKNDDYYYGLQNNVSVGDSEQNRPEEDQRCKQEGSNIYNRHEREERRDVKRDKEQSRGDYEDAQRKGTSSTKPCLSEVLEKQDKRRSGDVRQNRPDQKISVTRTTQKHVGVEEQTKERVYAKDTQHIQNRQIENKEITRQAGLPGKGRQTETERAGSVGKMRQDNSQSKDRAKCKEVTVDNRGGSQKARMCHGMIIDEEIKETPHGTQISRQTKHIRIETLGETSQGNIKSRVRPIKTNAKRKSGRKTDSQDTLSKGVDSLQLNEPKKHSAKRSLESVEEGNTVMDSNAKTARTEPRAQLKSKKKGAGGKIRRAWQRLLWKKQVKKKKQKRSSQSFSCIFLKKQTDSQTSESE